jgi:hypothetical protein
MVVIAVSNRLMVAMVWCVRYAAVVLSNEVTTLWIVTSVEAESTVDRYRVVIWLLEQLTDDLY